MVVSLFLILANSKSCRMSTGEKKFGNPDELKRWLIEQDVDEDHANTAAPLLLTKSHDDPLRSYMCQLCCKTDALAISNKQAKDSFL